MKKSRAVPLSLVSSLAAAAMAAGCGSHAQGWQTCVDRGSNVAVDRQYCDDEWGQTRPAGYVPHYHWYYYPRGYYGYGPAIGSPVPLGGTVRHRADRVRSDVPIGFGRIAFLVGPRRLRIHGGGTRLVGRPCERRRIMQRRVIRPRPDWERIVEGQGLIYHHTQGDVYWNESAYYAFSSREVDELEAATNELQRLALEAGQRIIDDKRFADFGIPDAAVDAIVWAWNQEPPAIYGRFDLAYDGARPPKLLEYNADTPTALLESSVVQWYWLKDTQPGADQFNSIHERLVAKWRELKDYMQSPLYFAAAEDVQAEDLMTTTYLRDTATEAGLETAALLIKDIGWNADVRAFVDLEERPIRSIFKLYPWEWLIHEEFGGHTLETYRDVTWIEPIWKMLWSNKALLAVLWELFPNHPNLLPAYLDGPRDLARYVKKPKMAREGANITLVGDTTLETSGDYGEEGFVYQALAPVPVFDGNYAVVGSWVVDGVSCGMGIRESNGPITNNLSRFVPHMFR